MCMFYININSFNAINTHIWEFIHIYVKKNILSLMSSWGMFYFKLLGTKRVTCINELVLTLDTVVQVFVADDIGRETMTPVGVTVPPVVGDTFNDIVIGCDKPGNDTWNGQCVYLFRSVSAYTRRTNCYFKQPEHFVDRW